MSITDDRTYMINVGPLLAEIVSNDLATRCEIDNMFTGAINDTVSQVFPKRATFRFIDVPRRRSINSRRHPKITLFRKGYGRSPVQITADLLADYVEARFSADEHVDAYVLKRLGSSITIETSSEIQRATILTSLVRDVLRRVFENLGGAILHASAVEYRSRAWLAVGPKGSGKTTTALALVAAGGALIDNDRVAVVPVGGELLAMPVRWSTRIALGTLNAMKATWDDAERLLEAAPTKGRHPATKKLYFSRGDLDFRGIRLSAGAPISGVIVPSMGQSDSGIRDSLKNSLYRSVYSPFDPGFPDDLLLLRRRTEVEIRTNGTVLARRLWCGPIIHQKWSKDSDRFHGEVVLLTRCLGENQERS